MKAFRKIRKYRNFKYSKAILFVLSFVFGCIIATTIGYSATIVINANVVKHSPHNNMTSTNLQGAIDELYNRTRMVENADNLTSLDIWTGAKAVSKNGTILTGTMSNQGNITFTSIWANTYPVNGWVNRINVTNVYMRGLADSNMTRCTCKRWEDGQNTGNCTATKKGWAYIVMAKYGSATRNFTYAINNVNTTVSLTDMTDGIYTYPVAVNAGTNVKLVSWPKPGSDGSGYPSFAACIFYSTY